MREHEQVQGCRLEVRSIAADPSHASAGELVAWATCEDGRWQMRHRDGRRVTVRSTVEVVERMIHETVSTSRAAPLDVA
jgi:hypothetical protein